jgi:16S rRNA processing protein RimM
MQSRNPIQRNNLSEVGFIKKVHGIQGELLVVFENGMEEAIEGPAFVFVEVEGLPVPFFVEGSTWRRDGSVNFKLRYIDSKEKAQEYIGCKVAVDNDNLNLNKVTFDPNQLIGYTVVDQKIGIIGKIEVVNDFGGNMVFSVNYKGNEVLVPFDDDLLVSFNRETATLVMDCPDGLLDLNN